MLTGDWTFGRWWCNSWQTWVLLDTSSKIFVWQTEDSRSWTVRVFVAAAAAAASSLQAKSAWPRQALLCYFPQDEKAIWLSEEVEEIQAGVMNSASRRWSVGLKPRWSIDSSLGDKELLFFPFFGGVGLGGGSFIVRRDLTRQEYMRGLKERKTGKKKSFLLLREVWILFSCLPCSLFVCFDVGSNRFLEEESRMTGNICERTEAESRQQNEV